MISRTFAGFYMSPEIVRKISKICNKLNLWCWFTFGVVLALTVEADSLTLKNKMLLFIITID